MPQPGDFTVCLYCENLMVFTEGLSLRAPTKEEEREAETNTDLIEVIGYIRLYRKLQHREH